MIVGIIKILDLKNLDAQMPELYKGISCKISVFACIFI